MTTSYIKEKLESFNYETKELRTTNQDMQTYIDSCNKERAAYKEHNNLHFKTLRTLPLIVIL